MTTGADGGGDGNDRARPRPALAALLVATVALGLASRRFGDALPPVVVAYAGDTLWAAMVFWLLALARPRAATSRLAAGALAIAVVVELSQLHHAPWIDAVRATRLGALALGHGFLWSDLACYAAGVGMAALLDRALVRPRARRGARALRLVGRRRGGGGLSGPSSGG